MSDTITAIDHVQLAMPAGVEHEAEAESFYSALLGLPRVAKPEPLASRGGCWFIAGPIQVHLGVEEPFAPARKAHPAFRVTDLDDLAERLRAAGHEVRWSDELPGTRRFHTDDPFGNRIELIQA
jgi:catechol 2,3-dioxygenase-like lactoylglutathione lyase family enzyme